MAEVTPAGPLTPQVTGLRTALAKVTALQVWMGFTGTGAEAATLAHIHEVEAPENAARPLVIVDVSAQDPISFSVEGFAQGPIRTSGSLIYVMHGEFDAEDFAGSYRRFYNAVGTVARDVLLQAQPLGLPLLREARVAFLDIVDDDLLETSGGDAEQYWVARVVLPFGVL